MKRCEEYNQIMSECFFRKIGYDRTNCFFKYKKNNQATTNDYKKYYYESDYNSFTGIINPESKKEEYLNIYNYLNFTLETNEKINLILKIYSKILKKEDITEELKKIAINKIGEEIKEELKRDFRYQLLLEEDKIIILLSIDGIINIVKNFK